jgi:trimethylamine monooxygenase
MGFKWPDGMKEVHYLDRLEGNKAIFKDGHEQNTDAIILCSGYLHHFPFLTDDLKLKTNNCLWPLGIYKGIFWVDNPKMMYLGMQDQFYTFNMFDVQAWYARDYMMGKIDLPNKDEMLKNNQDWKDREEKLETDEDMIWFQGDYTKELMEATDYPTFDIEGVNNLFMEWEHDKHNDIMGYRNKSYKSLMTGNTAPAHHTPWLDELDDSYDSYMKN